jgi:hypothetical protein
MDKYLSQIEYIYSEVNGSYVYEDCCLINELDDFLSQYGFKRVETQWCGNDSSGWGDAFYIKTK